MKTILGASLALDCDKEEATMKDIGIWTDGGMGDMQMTPDSGKVFHFPNGVEYPLETIIQVL